MAERMAFQPTAFEKKLRGDRRGRDDRREPRGNDRRRARDRREPLMTQTFSGIHNSIRGLAIGRKGAIQKLLTGRGTRNVGFMLERYSIEDDTIADYFKIVIRGTARDVLCAQRFIFNHIGASFKKAGVSAYGVVLPAGSRVVWTYDDELKSFVMEFKASARGQSVRSFLRECRGEIARPTPPMLPTNNSFDQEDADDEEADARPGSPAYSPTSPTYVPDAARPRTPSGPPPNKATNSAGKTDWTAPSSKIIADALAQSMVEAGLDPRDSDQCAHHRREAEQGLANWIAPVPQDNE
jgi:hypothetical protein